MICQCKQRQRNINDIVQGTETSQWELCGDWPSVMEKDEINL